MWGHSTRENPAKRKARNMWLRNQGQRFCGLWSREMFRDLRSDQTNSEHGKNTIVYFVYMFLKKLDRTINDIAPVDTEWCIHDQEVREDKLPDSIDNLERITCASVGIIDVFYHDKAVNRSSNARKTLTTILSKWIAGNLPRHNVGGRHWQYQRLRFVCLPPYLTQAQVRSHRTVEWWYY